MIVGSDVPAMWRIGSLGAGGGSGRRGTDPAQPWIGVRVLRAPVSGGGPERLELVGLMLEQAGEDLREGALPVAEPEAVLRRDRVQLAVGELSDSAERVARGIELLDHRVDVDVVCAVAVVVLSSAVLVVGVVLRSVAERAEESGDAMPVVRG